MLSIKDLSKSFRRDGKIEPILRNVSLEVQAGEFLAIIGPSGCGKTTLLRTIASLESAESGTIRFSDPASLRIGFMFQHPPLLPWKTALENVLLASSASESAGDATARARECLSLVRLENFADYLPHQLSAGMKSRVSLAQTLFIKANLLLLDEPFAALDEVNRDKLNEELLGIAEAIRTTLVLVTHSISEAAYVADRIVTMTPDRGRDSVQSILQSPLARPRERAIRRTRDFTDLVEGLRDQLQ